jgi:hypothetical protein
MESGRSHFVMPALVAGIPIIWHGRAFMIGIAGSSPAMTGEIHLAAGFRPRHLQFPLE